MTLTQAVVTAVLLWSPAREHNQPQLQGSLAETPEAYEARINSVASDIVEVVSLPEEEPLFDPSRTPEADYKSAIMVAALGFFESRFMLYIRSCNDYAWRKTAEGRRQLLSGDCDGGLAWTYWQVHPAEGLVLTPEGGWSRAYNFPDGWRATHSGEIIGGAEMLSDTKVAVRVVVHMLRQSLKRSGGLTGYTGETESNFKAAARLNFARNYWTSHPWRPDVDSDE